jgi:predicted acetyltransferase
MPFVEITTDPDNFASQRVILRNGGRLLGRVPKDASLGGGESLLFRIDLA